MLFRLFVILTKWKGCNIIDAVISHLYKLIWSLVHCYLITKLTIGDSIISACSSLDNSVWLLILIKFTENRSLRS